MNTVVLAELPGRACPIAASLELIGERWSLLIIRELALGNRRFSGIVKQTGAPRDRVAAQGARTRGGGPPGDLPVGAATVRLPPDRVGPGSGSRSGRADGMGFGPCRRGRRP